MDSQTSYKTIMKTCQAAAALLTLLLALPAAARKPAADTTLAREMKGATVTVVPPRTVHLRGEGMATVRHHPLQGFDTGTYPELFAERAHKLLGQTPTRWKVVTVVPHEDWYRRVETSDPDGVAPETLPGIPAVPADEPASDYIAVFRYAEFAYGVDERPGWLPGGQMVVEHYVELTLDLQLVVYDGASGEPLESFDAEWPVDVPEVQGPALTSKAFYRSTVGALKRMRKRVATGR